MPIYRSPCIATTVFKRGRELVFSPLYAQGKIESVRAVIVLCSCHICSGRHDGITVAVENCIGIFTDDEKWEGRKLYVCRIASPCRCHPFVTTIVTAHHRRITYQRGSTFAIAAAVSNVDPREKFHDVHGQRHADARRTTDTTSVRRRGINDDDDDDDDGVTRSLAVRSLRVHAERRRHAAAAFARHDDGLFDSLPLRDVLLVLQLHPLHHGPLLLRLVRPALSVRGADAPLPPFAVRAPSFLFVRTHHTSHPAAAHVSVRGNANT